MRVTKTHSNFASSQQKLPLFLIEAIIDSNKDRRGVAGDVVAKLRAIEVEPISPEIL
jgi:hypothetical protein